MVLVQTETKSQPAQRGRELQLASDEERVRRKKSQQAPHAKLQLASDELRVRHQKSQQAPPAATTFKCSHCGRDKLQALVYDILPLEEGAGKRCLECAAGTVTPASPCTATTGAAPVPADRRFSRSRSMATRDRRISQK